MKTLRSPLSRRSHRRARERGVTLIVALIMLLALGLLAAWAAKSGTTNLRIVGNAQNRQMALDVAQTAIEQTISSQLFSQNPSGVAANPLAVDVDGDGVADMTAQISPAPSCYRWRAIKQAELDPAVDADRACMTSSGGQTGIDSSPAVPTGDSLCATSEWTLRAAVTDANTGATVAVDQGVGIRSLITDVNTVCP